MAEEMEYNEGGNGEGNNEEGIVAKVRKDIRDYRSHTRNWRNETKTNYDMFAGRQWTVDELALLKEQQRVPVVFNRSAKIINCVTGLELQNRQEINCVPFGLNADPQKQGINDLGTSAIRWARSETNAEDVESEAYEDALICGVGGTYTYMDYESDVEGVLADERIDPLMLAFDISAKKKNVEDARWKAIAKKYTKKDFYDTYPEALKLEGGQSLFDDADLSYDNKDEDYTADSNFKNTEVKGMIEVIIYQTYKLEPIYKVANPILDPMTGQPQIGPDGKPITEMAELNQEDFAKVEEQIKAAGLDFAKQNKRVYCQYIVAGGMLLNPDPEKQKCPVDGFSINILTGLRDRNTNTWFGLMRMMHDPQKWANKWLSQIMHILNSNAKGGYLFESGAFKNSMQAEKDMARPDKNVELNVGGLTKIQPKPQPNYPEGIDRLLQYAMEAISDAPGVPRELMGLTQHNQPGVVEDSRKNAGVTIIAQFVNALRRFRIARGKIYLKFIQNYISDGRLIRIDEKNNSRYVSLFKDKLASKYDIMIDDAPTSVNQKEKTFNILMQILPLAVQAGVPVPPELLDYTALPQAFIDEWKKYIYDNMSDPVKQKNAEVEIAMKEGQAAKLKSDAFLSQAKAQEIITGANHPQNNPLEKMMDVKIESMKQEGNRIKSMAEVHKAHATTQQAKINLISSMAKLRGENNSNQQ